MMSRVARFFLLACLVIAVMPVFPATARAQGDLDDPQTGQVTTSLEARGYRVLDVGFAADDQGQPDLSTVYVAMQAVEPQLDTEVTIRQVVFGFSALREAYPDAATLVVALEVEQYWLLFPTSVENFDKWYNELIGFDEFWSPIRRDVRILDTATGEFIAEQDFTSKDFTNKDFNGDTPPPPPQEPG
ncbi:MAG TPA: hypothetical protein VER55_05470, partial [Ardenticatenaceae bacterium]|nr:hypothetical protein [Ardenticatenaceae bacterium]